MQGGFEKYSKKIYEPEDKQPDSKERSLPVPSLSEYSDCEDFADIENQAEYSTDEMYQEPSQIQHPIPTENA